MKPSNNVVCLDLTIGNSIEPEHLSNMNIIGINLADFNERFSTDFILYYDPDGYSFELPEEHESNELLIWFVEGIGELLAFAYSPSSMSYDDFDLYLEERRKEINYLHNKQLFDNYRKRYIDYAPLGFLEESDYLYIKNKLTNMILDKQNTLYEN